MGSPRPRQRRVQRGDGGPTADLLAQRVGECGQRIARLGGQVGGRIGQHGLDVAEHALGQVTGDRGGLGVGVAQIEDQAGRATWWRGGQLRLGDDRRGWIGQDELLSSRRDGWIPGRSQRCVALVGDRGVDPGIDADGVLADRNGPPGRTAGAAGGRR
jgi:hypothetical protein